MKLLSLTAIIFAATTASASKKREHDVGLEAKQITVAALRQSEEIRLEILPRVYDRYGRLLASVIIDGVDLADTLIGLGHGRAYDGGRRMNWCSFGKLSAGPFDPSWKFETSAAEG